MFTFGVFVTEREESNIVAERLRNNILTLLIFQLTNYNTKEYL